MIQAPAAAEASGSSKHAHPPHQTAVAFTKLHTCITIRRTLKKLDQTQLPLDEIGACRHRDAAKLPLSTPGKPHDTRRQHADAVRVHPYNEIINVANNAEKSARIKHSADVDRAWCPFRLLFSASPCAFCSPQSTVMLFPRMMANKTSPTRLPPPFHQRGCYFRLTALPGVRENFGLKFCAIRVAPCGGSLVHAKPAVRSVHSPSLYFSGPALGAPFELDYKDHWL